MLIFCMHSDGVQCIIALEYNITCGKDDLTAYEYQTFQFIILSIDRVKTYLWWQVAA